MDEIVFTEEQKTRLRLLGQELYEAAAKDPIYDNRVALHAKATLALSLAANDRMAPADRRKAIFKPW